MKIDFRIFIATIVLTLAVIYGILYELNEAKEAESAQSYEISAIRKNIIDSINREREYDKIAAIDSVLKENEAIVANYDKKTKIAVEKSNYWRKLASDKKLLADSILSNNMQCNDIVKEYVEVIDLKDSALFSDSVVISNLEIKNAYIEINNKKLTEKVSSLEKIVDICNETINNQNSIIADKDKLLRKENTWLQRNLFSIGLVVGSITTITAIVLL